MTPAAATALPADMLQSVRSSCDRCRLFKLKCAVPPDSDGPVACERCRRAKVPCIFGRRRRATRSNDGPKRQQQKQQQQPSPITPSSSASPVLPHALTSHPTSADLVGTIVSPVPDVSIHATATATTITTGAPLSAWDWPPQHGSGLDGTYMMDCTNSIPGCQQQPGHRGLWDWPPSWHGHQGGGTDDMDPYLCLNNTSNPTDTSQQGGASPSPPFVAEVTPPPTVRPTTSVTTDEGLATSSGFPSTSNNSSSGEHLLALIADMQQTLKMLEEGSWRNGYGDDNNDNDSVPSLDDYPLGTVLNLSQEFSAIAASVLKRVRAAEAAAMSPAPSSITTKTESGLGVQGPGTTSKGIMTGGLASVDMATMVLILGGHMWLSHMYSVVLGHFQQHLSQIHLAGGVQISNPHHPNFHFNTIPSIPLDQKNSCNNNNNPYPMRLKLGELSCSSAAPDLGRIHNALSMLLAAMRGVEDQLGRGGAVVRNLVLARLSHDALLAGPGGLVEGDGSGGLEWRVKLVKELLRERMGL